MNEAAKISSDGSAAVLPRPTPSLQPKRERAVLAKSLPTDRVTVEKQIEIIRAYAAVYAANDGQPVTNDQVGDIVNLSGSTISQTNSFFTDIGFIIRSDELTGFIPAPEVIEYNNACQWDAGEARSKLRPIFERTWFYRCLVPRLQLAPQSQTTCLALLAGESKAQTEQNERLLNLLGFLEEAGIVSKSNGNVSLVQHKALTIQPKPDEHISPKLPPNTPKAFSDHEENSFYLDKEKKKRITLVSPLFLTRAEFKRLITWIESTLIVEEEQKNN
jgi:hypothetical protein